MPKPRIRTKGRPYPRLKTPVIGETLTKSAFKDECDINKIMGKYLKTGILPRLNPNKPNYGFAPSFDFREAMELVQNMNSNFDELPVDIRKQFGFDPALFLEFVEDPANGPKMAAMGLLENTGATPPESRERGVKTPSRRSAGKPEANQASDSDSKEETTPPE